MSEVGDEFATQVSGVGSLADPMRRSLYTYVCAQPDPVSTDQAAAATEIARHNAKFHLDRLVNEGLLETEFRRPAGRGGPGAGRPTKVLPARRARAVRHAARASLRPGGQAAGDRRRRLPQTGFVRTGGADASCGKDRPSRPPSRRSTVTTNRKSILSPRRTERWRSMGMNHSRAQDTITLANCPFQALAKDHTELVCGMNLALVGAITERLGDRKLISPART